MLSIVVLFFGFFLEKFKKSTLNRFIFIILYDYICLICSSFAAAYAAAALLINNFKSVIQKKIKLN